MPQVVIENPILNSPFEEPSRHFRFTEDGISNEIVASRRTSSYFVPIPRAKKKGKQLVFDNGRDTYMTAPAKCQFTHVTLDSGWEAKFAQTLEEMPAVVSYVKNHHLGFAIPYTIDGEEHQYLPDFIVRLDDSHDPGDLLNLIVEVTGEKRKDKAAKVATARALWVPAVNNHGGFGRWGFIEIDDPWNACYNIQHVNEE